MYRIKNHIYVLITPTDPSETLSDDERFLKIDGISGLEDYIGFSQTVDVQTGNVRDYVLKQTIDRQTINVELYFRSSFDSNGNETSAYSNMYDFMTHLGNYVSLEDYKMTLIIGLGNGNGSNDHTFNGDINDTDNNYGLRIDFYPKSVKPSGLSQAGVCTLNMTIQALSCFYTEETTVSITSSHSETKTYAYDYPYNYGGKSVSGQNGVNNTFISSIPVKLTLSSTTNAIYSPVITLRKPGSFPYCEIVFSDLTIYKNRRLVIDSVNYLAYIEEDVTDTLGNITAVKTTSVIDKIDKSHASFLWARPGMSILSISPSNTSSSDTWTAEAVFTKYQVC